MTYDVWMEGFVATGESGTAMFLGSFEAPTFRDACKQAIADWGDLELFNESNLTYWACRLFDNEVDARRNFG